MKCPAANNEVYTDDKSNQSGTPRTDAYDSMTLMSLFEVLNVVFGTADITNYAVQN